MLCGSLHIPSHYLHYFLLQMHKNHYDHSYSLMSPATISTLHLSSHLILTVAYKTEHN